MIWTTGFFVHDVGQTDPFIMCTTMNSVGKLIDVGFKNASITNLQGQQFKLSEKPFWVWKACQGGNKNKDIVNNFSTEFNVSQGDAKKEIGIIFETLENSKLVSEE